jgi:uncharacterized protein YdeI (YjbR/CyaY-like superfamily)
LGFFIKWNGNLVSYPLFPSIDSENDETSAQASAFKAKINEILAAFAPNGLQLARTSVWTDIPDELHVADNLKDAFQSLTASNYHQIQLANIRKRRTKR